MSTTVSSPSSMNVIDAWKTAMEFHFDRFQAAREACRSLMINEVRQRMLQDLRPSSPLYQQQRVQSIHDDDGDDEASFSPSSSASSQSVTAMLDGDDSNYALISRTCNLRGSDGTTLVTFTDNDAAEKKITPHVEMPVLDECDVVKGLPIPRPVVALAAPPAIAKVKKSKPRKPKDPPVASGGGKRRQRAPASASATVFPFDVHETSQHVADRRAAIRRLIAQMPLDKQEWRWKGPKQKKPRATKRRKTDDDEDGQTLAAAAKPKSAPVPKKGYPKDSAVGLWLDAMCKCLAGFTHRVFTRTVDMNGVMDEVLRSPAPGAQEVKNDGIIEIPRDFRCMDCRQGIQTSQQNTRKDLAILLCECERRKASICLSCKVARWARELPCSDGGPDLQPFDGQGNLKRVKCQAPRCQTYWTPEDLLILQTVTKFYAPPPVSAN